MVLCERGDALPIFAILRTASVIHLLFWEISCSVVLGLLKIDLHEHYISERVSAEQKR